jgi:hypothetical protein
MIRIDQAAPIFKIRLQGKIASADADRTAAVLLAQNSKFQLLRNQVTNE